MSKNKDKEFSFEEAVVRLEEIVGKLEAGNVPLDESLKLFEEGVKLSRFCSNKLEEIERKIEVLTNDTDSDGQPVAKPFEAGEEE